MLFGTLGAGIGVPTETSIKNAILLGIAVAVFPLIFCILRSSTASALSSNESQLSLAINGTIVCGNERVVDQYRVIIEASFHEQREKRQRSLRQLIERIASEGLRG